jgi:hypothetical protein
MLEVLLEVVQGGQERPLKLHLAGHGSGAIVLAQILSALSDLTPTLRISTVSLLGAALNRYDFVTHALALMETPRDSMGINRLVMYNLSKDDENSDATGPYSRSLLHLIHRAFEDDPNMPLVGMEPMNGDHVIRRLVTGGRNFFPDLQIRTCGDQAFPDVHTHAKLAMDPQVLTAVLRDMLEREPTRSFGPLDFRSF